MFDLRCMACGDTQLDVREPSTLPDGRMPCRKCGAMEVQRVWIGKAAAVIGDECDVVVTNGICNPDGTPRRYRSKADMRREAAAQGLEPHVTHIGTRGGDRSKHTTRWF